MLHSVFESAFLVGQRALKFHKLKKKKKKPRDFGRDTIKNEIGANLPIVATLLADKLLRAKVNVNESVIPALAKAAAPIAKQALVWGLGSALGTKMAQSKKRKKMTPEERKKALKTMLISGGIGALAGAAGAAV